MTQIGTDALARPRLGISACLLGQAVRYDGGHKLDRFLQEELGRLVDAQSSRLADSAAEPPSSLPPKWFGFSARGNGAGSSG